MYVFVVLKSARATCKRTELLATSLAQQCWKLLRPCWQWWANGSNNSQQCWDLRCIVGRIQPRRLWRPCVTRVRGPNNVGKAVQTNPILLCYAWWSRNKRNFGSCWFNRPTGFNNSQQHATTYNRVCKRTHLQHSTMGVVGQQCPYFTLVSQNIYRLMNKLEADGVLI